MQEQILLLRLPGGHSLPTMPPLPARSGTKTRSSAAPDPSFLLLGVQGDEKDWERKACVSVMSQSSAVFGVSPSVRAEERDGSALPRALPASLHTFLFRIRGWLHEQAAGIGEELDKTQFRTWKPRLPFGAEDEEVKSPGADRAPCPPRPARCHLPRQTSRESASPCPAGSPAHSPDTAAALEPR